MITPLSWYCAVPESGFGYAHFAFLLPFASKYGGFRVRQGNAMPPRQETDGQVEVWQNAFFKFAATA